MKRLFPNTLRDIARHSNKTIKLADYLVKTELDLHVSTLAKLDPQADPVSLIAEFDKDLSKTANAIFDVHELISTADENHIVHHLKNPEKNLVAIFGDKYDPVQRELKFKNFNLPLSANLDVDSIKHAILKSILDMGLPEYTDLKARRKKIFRFNDAELDTETDKVQYLSAIKEVEQFKDAINTMRTIAANYISNRSKMGGNSLNLIDREITFERAMVDSVANTSTYISKTLGMEQVSSKHKHDAVGIRNLVEKIDASELVDAVEVDQDASVEGMVSAMRQLEDIKPNMSTEGRRLIFKSRKLGNYNANGLYSVSSNILAVDIKSPSSIIHELTHAVDYNNDAIRGSNVRRIMVSALRKEMNAEEMREVMPERLVKYYLRDTEVVARMGEIGYLLNKFEYKPEEGMEKFIERVRQSEAGVSEAYDLNLSHPINHYLNARNIYFNFQEMDPSLLVNVQKFSRAFFGVNGAEPEIVNDIKVEKAQTKDLGKRDPSARYELKSVSLFTGDNIRFAMEYNDVEKVVEPEALFRHLLTQITHIDRSTLAYPKVKQASQQKAIQELADYMREKDVPYLTYLALNNLVETGLYDGPRGRKKNLIDLEQAIILRDGVRNNTVLSMQMLKDHYADELAAAEERTHQANEDSRSYETHDEYVKKRHHYMEVKREEQVIRSKPMNQFRAMKEELMPDTADVQQNMYKYWHAETKKSGKNAYGKANYQSSHFLNGARAQFNQPIAEYVIEQLNSDKAPEILNYLTQDDNALYALLADQGLRTLIEPEKRGEFDKHLSGIVAANGLLDTIYNNPLFTYEDGKDKILVTGTLLEVFPYHELGINNIADLSIAIQKRELLQSALLQIAPDSFSGWYAAQMRKTDIEQEFSGEKDFAPLTVDNIEEVIEKFDTHAFLDDLENELLNPEPLLTTALKTPIAAAQEAEQLEEKKLAEQPKAPEPKPEPVPVKASPKAKNQLSLF